MKVVSRLVKMEVRLGSLERKGEEILSRSDPASDTAQTKMYISPDDLVGLAKLINSSVVGYLFLFPIFYTARFLRQIESRKGSLTKIWERTAILFGCLLIWGGVAGVPFPASLFLFFLPFSIFFLLIAFYNRKGDFIFPMAFLQGVSIYLLARFFSLQDLQIPLLGSLLVLIWFWLARRWKTRRELALSLYRGGYWAASFFTYEVLRTFFQRGVEKDPALFWMIPPLLIFALYFWACYFQAKKHYLQQLAIAIMAIGYILLIFAIPSLPLEYLGPGLVLFAMGLTAAGMRVKRVWGDDAVQPLFRMGIVLATASFLFSFWEVNLFSVHLALYSALYFETNFRMAGPPAEEAPEEGAWTLKDLCLVLALAGSIVFAGTYFFLDRPLGYGPIIASLAYGVYFFRLGLHRDGWTIQNRNPWFYLSAFFFSIGFFSSLAWMIPPLGIEGLLFSGIPVIALLGAALRYGRSREIVQTSVIESSYLFVVIAGGWILSQKSDFFWTSLGLIFIWALTYGVVNTRARNKGLWYSFAFLVVFFTYTLLRLLSQQEFLGFYMIPPGWVFLFLAVRWKRRGHAFQEVGHLTWFLFCLASVQALLPRLTSAAFGFMLWSLSLLAAAMLTGKEGEEGGGGKSEIEGESAAEGSTG